MTTTLAVGFANVGRGTVAQTRAAIHAIATKMDTFDQAALLLNEVDEADTADEHGLLSAAFRTWEDHAWDTREPILTRGLTTKRAHSRVAARGVPHQSPARPINEVTIDGGTDPDIVLIGGHLPAGAHNGHRAPVVKAQLVVQYVAMLRQLRKRIRHHRKAGRHVVWAMDVNWRHLPRLALDEGTLTAHPPDYVRVIPARGWTAHRLRVGNTPLPIEQLHRLEWAVVEFRPVKQHPPKETP